MPKLKTFAVATLTLLFFMQLMACSQLTQENYDKVKMGMSFQEVEKLLGTVSTCDSVMVMKSCTWGTDQTYVKIQFMSDKVVMHAAKGLK